MPLPSAVAQSLSDSVTALEKGWLFAALRALAKAIALRLRITLFSAWPTRQGLRVFNFSNAGSIPDGFCTAVTDFSSHAVKHLFRTWGFTCGGVCLKIARLIRR